MMGNKYSFSKRFLQDNAADVLQHSVKTGLIRQTYIFTGPEGIGKKYLAMTFAALLQCENPSVGCSGLPDSCGLCNSCRRIISGNHPDLAFIQPAGSDIKIGQIRDMQENAFLNPYMSSWRIFIFDPADRLNESSSNCLLKILEEAPEKVIFILLCINESNVLPTIRSRSEIIRFRKATHAECRNYLADELGFQKDEADLLYAVSEGRLLPATELTALSLTEFSEATTSIRHSNEQLIRDIERYGEKLREKLTSADTPDRILREFGCSTLTSYPELLVSIKAFCRSLLMQRDIPKSFPVLFSAGFLGVGDGIRKGLKADIQKVVNANSHNYSHALLKDFEEGFNYMCTEITGEIFRVFILCLLNWLKDVFHWRMTEDETILLNLDRKEDIMMIAAVRSDEFIKSGIELLIDAQAAFDRFVQPALIMENILTYFGEAPEWKDSQLYDYVNSR